MKTLAYILILTILLTTLWSPAEASISADAIRDARNDAEMDIDKELWFTVGLCLGGIGYTIAFLTTPDLPTSRFIGKPPEYVFFYIQEYERKTKRFQSYYSFLGSITGCGVTLILSYLYIGVRGGF